MYIAITFDDGPNTETTPRVLDVLEKEGIRATFFLIAQNINDETAEAVRRAVSLGCDIENHSVTHTAMDTMTPEAIRREVDECSDRIRAITGRAPEFFRPPYIALNQQVYDNVDLTMICGKGCQDWEQPVSAEERARRVLTTAEHGDIVLLHDFTGNEKTVEALKTSIPELKRRGFSFVTCRELFRLCNITPVRNRIYSNVFQTVKRMD